MYVIQRHNGRPGVMSTLGRILVASVILMCAGQTAQAGIITSPGGNYQVGIDDVAGGGGTLYDLNAGIGFRRVGDGFDPIAPGTPRDSWGVSAGVTSGYSDPADFGTNNINLISAVFNANSAVINSSLNAGSGNILTISQTFTFLAQNVLQVATTVTNVSGAPQSVLFQRDVDWDDDLDFSDNSYIPARTLPIIETTFYGFENPDPLSPYSSDPGPAGGVDFGGDDGNGIKVDLGLLADGSSVSFNYYYGINAPGQTRSDLVNQMLALGATYVASEESNPDPGLYSSALGFSPLAAPEPTSMTLMALGAVGLLGYSRRWRKARAAAAV